MASKVVKMFPSPCGEKVGINQQRWVRLTRRCPLFPSPCGEKVGINFREVLYPTRLY